MDWQSISAIAAVVGAGGVIVALIYLATQIRQNTNQLQGGAINAINAAQVTLLRDFRDDMELVSAFIKCANNWESGSPQEQFRVHTHMLSYVFNFETAYNLWRTGALPETIYKNREDLIVSLITPRGIRTWWDMRSSLFDSDFVARITNRTNAADAPEIFDVLPFMNPKLWK